MAADQGALWAIVYASRAIRPLSTRELDHLLVGARWFNRRVGVTGALLHHDGTFFQYIEGAREGVEAAYARIQSAPMHTALRELFNQAVPARQFEQWYMACAETNETVLQDLCNQQWERAAVELPHGGMVPGAQALMQFWTSVQAGARPEA